MMMMIDRDYDRDDDRDDASSTDQLRRTSQQFNSLSTSSIILMTITLIILTIN